VAETTFTYSVTFESRTIHPVTVRGEISAASTQAGVRLAVKDAMSKERGRRWTSLVVLLMRPDGEEA
jgi:hypothetical protein